MSLMQKKMIEIVTDDPHVTWHTFSSADDPELVIHGRGYSFFKGLYVEDATLVNLVWQECHSENTVDLSFVKNLCEQLNGAWALIIELPDRRVIAAVDRCRNIPVFYTRLSEKVILSVSMDHMLSKMKTVEINDDLALEFLLTRNVTHGETLFRGVRQVLPGEMIVLNPLDDVSISSSRYYRFLPHEYVTDSEADLEINLANTIKTVFSRYVEACRNKTILVPLSGGLDSRLLVAMLKEFGARDVICFTYGKKGNPESVISQKVAECVRYEWRFVESTPEVWTQSFASKKIMEYWDYCCKGSCLPHIQEFPVISLFSQDEAMNNNITVWPGIAMDFLAGSLLEKSLKINPSLPGFSLAEEYIIRRRYNLWPVDWTIIFLNQYGLLRKRVRKLTDISDYNINVPLATYELYEAEHRIAYFLNNSVRLYEFFAMRWHLPFWDYEFADVFLSLPLKYRLGKRLYVNTLIKKVFIGSLSELKLIPIYDFDHTYRDWNRIITDSNGNYRVHIIQIKKAIKSLLKKLSLLDSINKKIKRRETSQQFHNNDWWFSQGQNPSNVRLIDALSRYHSMDILPEKLIEVFKPWLDSNLSELKCYAIFAVVMLTRIYDAYHKN